MSRSSRFRLEPSMWFDIGFSWIALFGIVAIEAPVLSRITNGEWSLPLVWKGLALGWQLQSPYAGGRLTGVPSWRFLAGSSRFEAPSVPSFRSTRFTFMSWWRLVTEWWESCCGGLVPFLPIGSSVAVCAMLIRNGKLATGYPGTASLLDRARSPSGLQEPFRWTRECVCQSAGVGSGGSLCL